MDFSQTKRIVLLIDLNPLLHLPSSSSLKYISTILASARIILSFHPLRLSLFTFRLFFSSLSPLLSSSKLHPFLGRSASSLSFQRPSETLCSLSSAFDSISSHPNFPDLKNSSSKDPQAQFVCGSLVQLVHDYGWDALILDHSDSPRSNAFLRSNLFILFSPFVRSLKSLSEYLSLCLEDSLLAQETELCDKFCDIFGSVSEILVNRDIYCCWIDVKFDLEYSEVVDRLNGSELKLDVFEKSIGKLGWGISSTGCIILGSALVPFGLIYSRIAALPRFEGCSGCYKLSLEILDAKGKSLECKLCELHLVNDSMLPVTGNEYVSHIQCSETSFYGNRKDFWWRDSDGVKSVHVKSIIPHDKLDMFGKDYSDVIILHDLAKHEKEAVPSDLSGFFADRVLQILSVRTDVSARETSILLQIFLTYLYRGNFSALVSLSDSKQNLCMGILTPFTTQSSFVSILDTKRSSSIQDFCYSIRCSEMESESAKCYSRRPFKDITNSNSAAYSQKGYDVGLRGKAKKITKNFCSLTWKSFCKEAFDNSHMKLEDVYFARKLDTSKRLKFLKCWMKQMRKSNKNWELLGGPDLGQKVSEVQETNSNMDKEANQAIPSASIAENSPREGSENLLPPEVSEAFLSSLQDRIRQGLESNAVDLSTLAARVVNSSFTILWKKHEKALDSDNLTPELESQDVSDCLVAEVIDLLLVDPKDLFTKHKNVTTSEPTPISRSALSISEYTLREYELQVLFRMEILASEIGFNIDEHTKQKFVKQICSLLEKTMYHMDGGFFGGVSLQDYADKVIRSRYAERLGDVVWRIYDKMDLLTFDEEDECAPNPLLTLSSEDSSQSASPQVDKRQDELCVAREKRDRARRFASFTSRGADLRRVWAPKTTKPPPPHATKNAKRKRHEITMHDSVCETPTGDAKRSRHADTGECSDFIPRPSVNRALFRDDWLLNVNELY